MWLLSSKVHLTTGQDWTMLPPEPSTCNTVDTKNPWLWRKIMISHEAVDHGISHLHRLSEITEDTGVGISSLDTSLCTLWLSTKCRERNSLPYPQMDRHHIAAVGKFHANPIHVGWHLGLTWKIPIHASEICNITYSGMAIMGIVTICNMNSKFMSLVYSQTFQVVPPNGKTKVFHIYWMK